MPDSPSIGESGINVRTNAYRHEFQTLPQRNLTEWASGKTYIYLIYFCFYCMSASFDDFREAHMQLTFWPSPPPEPIDSTIPMSAVSALFLFQEKPMHSQPFEPSNAAIRKVTLPHVSILNGPQPTAVAKPVAVKPKDDAASAKLILVGLDDQGKPHAAWFTEEQVDAATLAADIMDMASISVEGEELVGIAGVLPKGKLFESGKAFVPFTKRETYDRLAAYLDDDYIAATAVRIEAAKVSAAAAAAESYAKASKGEAPLHVPEDWSKLAVGDLVLATEDPADGWWACEVLEVLDNDQYRLRWRDFPEELPTTKRITDLALVHPQCKTY